MNGPRVAKTATILFVLARYILAVLFIYMGLTTALHSVEFLKQVRQYDVLHDHLMLNLIASTLPWLEVFCGVLLALGIAVRGVALVLVAMLIPFTILVLLRALHVQEMNHLPFCAIKFDCGCGAGEIFICRKLTENILLLAISTVMIFWPNQRFSLWHTLTPSPD